MPRPLRVDVGGIVYHVFNRANAKVRIFDRDGDYKAMLAVLAEAHEKAPMRLLSYCIMPNHWHLVLWPLADGHLSRFMEWMTGTHSHRWQSAHGLVGFGHVYQGHYKNFPVENDRHYLTLFRYVERNPVRAKLARHAEDWPWGSAYQRTHVPAEGYPPLAKGPMNLPEDWSSQIERDPSDKELDAIRQCISRGRPFGGDPWTDRVAHQLRIESTLRPRGRPRHP